MVQYNFKEYSIAQTKIALLDTFSGLVKVKPIKIIESEPFKYIQCEVLETIGAYKQGEISDHIAECVIPKDKLIPSDYNIKILPSFKWVD